LQLNLKAALACAAILPAALAAVPAGAEDARPAPCAGVLIEDPAGDNTIGPLGTSPVTGSPFTSKGPESQDVRRVWFNTVGGVTTANIEITNLTKELPAEIRTGAISYLLDFDLTEGISFVRAENNKGTISYHAATVTTVPGAGVSQVTGQKTLKGAFIEGPNGVVQIELPPELSKPGTVLKNVFTNVSIRTDETNYVGYVNETAPDDGATSKKEYAITECPTSEPTATPTASATAEPTASATPQASATPSPTPQGGPPQQTPSGTQPAQPGPGSGQPATPAQPTKGKAKRKQPTCQAKANRIKNKAKRKAALKKCKKVKKKGKR
jgi:hypothetical protein